MKLNYSYIVFKQTHRPEFFESELLESATCIKVTAFPLSGEVRGVSWSRFNDGSLNTEANPFNHTPQFLGTGATLKTAEYPRDLEFS